MNILQVSIYDLNGGAERVAWDLHHAYLRRGHLARLLVGGKRSGDPAVTGLWPRRWSPAWWRYRLQLELEIQTGVQAAHYSMFRQYWRAERTPRDILHLHNLHSHYFDLKDVARIARSTPLVQTLHDCWTLTGHCSHPRDCLRWRESCGACPDLTAYPSVRVDRTAFNLRRKIAIYNEARPTLVTPSRWLADMVARSRFSRLRCEVVPYGVDTERFRPGNQAAARERLRLPVDRRVALFVANGGLAAPPPKDPWLALRAIEQLLVHGGSRWCLVVVGGEAPVPEHLRDKVLQQPWVQGGIEGYYQAADVLLHATRADNAPLAILEASACGLPVVTTNVGGCSELIEEGVTGFSVAPGDAVAMAAAAAKLTSLDGSRLRERARERAVRYHSLSAMTDSYLRLYQDISQGGIGA